MSKARKRRTRRHRRQNAMKIRSKGKFKVGHKSPSGRTGSIRSKQIAAVIAEVKRLVPDVKRHEVHVGCGGIVKLGRETWRCSKCREVCSVHETKLVEDVRESRGGPTSCCSPRLRAPK